MPRRLTDDDEARLVRLYGSGISGKKLHGQFGVSLGTVYLILRRHGALVRSFAEARRLSPPSKMPPLEEEAKQQIIKEYVSGKSSKTVADEMSLDQGQVARFLAKGGHTRPPHNKFHRPHKINEDAFAGTLSPEARYFVGLIMADGCVVQRGRSAILSISLAGDDGDHLNALKKFLSSDHPIKLISGRTNARGIKSAPARKITIGSTKICQDLAAFGVTPNKSHTAAVIGLEDDRDYWRGMIDGDGYLTIKKSESGKESPCVGLVGSLPTCQQFSAYVRAISSAKGTVNRLHSIYDVRIKGRPAMAVIRNLYQGCSVALPRKLLIATDFMARFF